MVLRVPSDYTICFLESTFKAVLWAVPTALAQIDLGFTFLLSPICLSSTLEFIPVGWRPALHWTQWNRRTKPCRSEILCLAYFRELSLSAWQAYFHLSISSWLLFLYWRFELSSVKEMFCIAALLTTWEWTWHPLTHKRLNLKLTFLLLRLESNFFFFFFTFEALVQHWPKSLAIFPNTSSAQQLIRSLNWPSTGKKITIIILKR